MLDFWRVYVFRWIDRDMNIVEEWLNRVERLESPDKRAELEGELDGLIDLLRQTRDPDGLSFFDALEERGDACQGIDALKFITSGMHRRVLGLRDTGKAGRRFAIYFADTKDKVQGPNRNPTFYSDACPEVNLREEAFLEGSGVLDVYENEGQSEEI